MKKACCLLALCITISTAFAQPAELETLVYSKQFTLLDSKLISKSYARLPQMDVYRALVLNAFSKPAESNDLITLALEKRIIIHDSLKFYLLQSQVNNFIALNDYKNAYAAGTALLKNYSAFFTSDQMEEEQEALKIWEQLIKVEPQTLKKNADTRLALTKDIAGLWNIPVKVNDSTSNFIFDSGAGISTVSASYATLLGLTVLDSSYIDVKSGITGIANKARIGIAKELHIGNIAVNNAVFIILPDSSLSFANGQYVIRGIIGFPVIREFEHFSITKNEIVIPRQDSSAIQQPNMAIDQLKPVIYLTYNNDVLPFTFDTGARTSAFSDNFYNRYKSLLEKAGKEKQVTMGGAGGSKTFNVLEMPEIVLKHYEKYITLKKAHVSKDKIDTAESYYYGNLGQDIIKQYDKMTINFKHSYILLE